MKAIGYYYFVRHLSLAAGSAMLLFLGGAQDALAQVGNATGVADAKAGRGFVSLS